MHLSKRIVEAYPESANEVVCESARAMFYRDTSGKGRITVTDAALYLEHGRWVVRAVERIPHEEILAFEITSQTESGLASMHFELEARPDLLAIIRFKKFEMGTRREDMARFVDAFDGWSKPAKSLQRRVEEKDKREQQALDDVERQNPGDRIVATARGELQVHSSPAVMADSGRSYTDKWNGELRLGSETIYVSYRKKLSMWSQSSQDTYSSFLSMKRSELTSWKHIEMDNDVGIELETDEFKVLAVLGRSDESDPDAFIEFCRSIEEDDLLIDAMFAFSAILDWELRKAASTEEHKQAAAETVQIVRDLYPAVFVTAAGLMAQYGTMQWTEGALNPATVDAIIDVVVEKSGYLEARRVVRRT